MVHESNEARMQSSNARTATADHRPANQAEGGMEMSASTRTIQRPIGQGSIFGKVALAAAVILAAVSITWGATNLVASKAVTTSVPMPVFLDQGSRGKLAAPLVLRAPAAVLHRSRTSTSAGPARQMRAQ
jgi:hypothetical protein